MIHDGCNGSCHSSDVKFAPKLGGATNGCS
jgi:hypothetical protein